MGCNCNQTTNYNICNPAPCTEPQSCDCPTILETKCVTFEGDDLECSGIKKGTILTELIQQLDAFICEKVNDITNALTLKNIGIGAKVYKGDDLLGRKELRTVTKTGNLVTVTENTNDIAVSIDEAALNTFIEANQKTYSATNIGTGASLYKDTTVSGDNTQFNFKKVNAENLGNGQSFLNTIQENTDDITVKIKTLVSDNLTITATDDEVRIETPSTASIPALYVNSLYVPTYNEWLTENKEQNSGTAVVGFIFRGKGSLAQPFTNSIVYPLLGGSATITADTAIENALDGDAIYSYVGSGTRLLPEKAGQKIIIQDNTTQYNFGGNFSYDKLNLEVNANINHQSPSYLIDMDNALYFNGNKHSVTITINEGYVITSNGDGLNNSGSNVATNNYSQSKTVSLKGKGLLYFPNNNITKYILNSDILSTGNNNDGNVTFETFCTIRADYQGVYKIGGYSRIYAYGTFVSGISSITVNTALKAFVHLGGAVRFFEGSNIFFTGARVDGFVFTPTGGFMPQFVGNSPTLGVDGTITNLFNKTNNNTVSFVLIDSQSGVLLSVTNIFESTNLWSVIFNNNNFESGTIDFTKVDLTNSNNVSAINIIGANIIESLIRYNDRAAAISAGVPLFAAYIKTSGVAYPSTSGWVRDIVLPA